MNIDIHAAGTWMKMMRYTSPCCASVGAATRPTYRPASASSAAAAAHQRAIVPASGKKVCGEANRNQRTVEFEFICASFHRDAQCGGDRPGREGGREHESRAQQQELPVGLQSRAGHLHASGAEDEDRDVER